MEPAEAVRAQAGRRGGTRKPGSRACLPLHPPCVRARESAACASCRLPAVMISFSMPAGDGAGPARLTRTHALAAGSGAGFVPIPKGGRTQPEAGRGCPSPALGTQSTLRLCSLSVEQAGLHLLKMRALARHRDLAGGSRPCRCIPLGTFHPADWPQCLEWVAGFRGPCFASAGEATSVLPALAASSPRRQWQRLSHSTAQQCFRCSHR